MQPKFHVEEEVGVGISELFDREDRDETGNFVVQIDRVIAATLRVTDVVKGSKVKAVFDSGIGDKDWNTRKEIQLPEWRPATSKGELVEAGHELREDGTTNSHVDTCDMDIMENFVVKSTLGDLLLACDMEGYINEKTRKEDEYETEETCKVSSVLVEDTTDIQSFPFKLKNNVMLEKITYVTDITEDKAEGGQVKRGIEIEVVNVSEEVPDELVNKTDRKRGNEAEVSIPGHLMELYRRFEKRRRKRSKESDEIVRKHVRWRQETEEEVAEESGEKGQDLLERAITLCDINEEVEFSPDYEEEEEEEEEIVTEEKEEEIVMAKKVEEKCVQTEMVWEDVERKRRMENRGFGDYIERLEKKLREKDREIERLREQLKRERDSRQEFGVDGSYGMDEFEEMWARRGSPEKKKMKSVVFRPERSRRY